MLTFVKALTKRENRYVAYIAMLAALGGFLFGFDTGVVGSAEPYFSKALGIGTFGESWVVGSLLLGAIVGAAMGGYLADALSRKWTKLAGGVVFFVAAIGSGFPVNVEQLCIARFVVGLGVGASSFVAPMYISEQSPKQLRGGMTAFNQVMITFGIMIAYLSDYAFSGIGADNWRWMFGVEAVPGAALAIAMLFVPHTPRWLVQRDRVDEARQVMQRTRPSAEIDDEIAEIQEVVEQQQGLSVRQALLSKRLMPFLVIGTALAALQQLVGINAVLYFGAQDLKFMGYTTSTSVHQAVTIGIDNWFFALLAVFLLDWVGRKALLVASAIGMGVALVGQGVYWAQGNAFATHHAIYGLISTLVFLAFFEIGLGPVMWVMISELFPLRVRSKAMAIATMVNWTFNFLVSYFYLTMQKPHVLGRGGTDWFFAGFCVVAAIFTLWKVPETKARSLEQIEREVAGSDQRAGRPRPAQA